MTLILLDRDGVINEDSDNYIRSVAEWRPIPGSIEAIARLSRAGCKVAVITNQSGLSRGYFSLDELQAMHDKLRELVAGAGGDIAGIFYCPHLPEDGCDCRKPRPGLIDQAMAVTGEPGTVLVGDSLKDLQAARARNCRAVLVKTGKGRKTLAQLDEFDGEVSVVNDLADFADQWLDATGNE